METDFKELCVTEETWCLGQHSLKELPVKHFQCSEKPRSVFEWKTRDLQLELCPSARACVCLQHRLVLSCG